jgi:ABC-2 type transport system ATP-binding protein
MTDAIVAEGLAKRYGDVVALDGMGLSVPEGTVFGLVGPNGAGKTTTVRVLRAHIGASRAVRGVDEYLTGAENLEMVGRLDHLGARSC